MLSTDNGRYILQMYSKLFQVNILLVLHNLHTVICMWACLVHACIHVCMDTYTGTCMYTYGIHTDNKIRWEKFCPITNVCQWQVGWNHLATTTQASKHSKVHICTALHHIRQRGEFHTSVMYEENWTMIWGYVQHANVTTVYSMYYMHVKHKCHQLLMLS
jgi:hypothetical protein